MCSNEGASALLPYGLKPVADGSAYAAAVAAALSQPTAGMAPGHPHAALEHYRLQLYNYAYVDRFRYASHPAFSPYAVASYPHGHHGNPHADSSSAAAAAAFALSAYAKLDPRAYRVQEEPKPQHSYIGLIGMAILSSPDKKLVLSDIYQYILDNYAYFRTRGPGWRNSIRHNLSLNDCFIKAGRSANGKGHYWAIHPANMEDFKKGDFRRRKAQRRVRKHMGLSVPEDEESLSPPPPPVPPPTHEPPPVTSTTPNTTVGLMSIQPRKRLFDVESLLAPDPRPGEEFEDDGDGRASTNTTPSSSPLPLTTTFRHQALTDEEPLHETPGRKYSPDTTADLSLNPHSHQQPQQRTPTGSWPGPLVLTGTSAWTCRKPEVGSGQSILNVHPQDSRWHEAVSRLLLRTQTQNSSKLPSLKITDVISRD